MLNAHKQAQDNKNIFFGFNRIHYTTLATGMPVAKNL